MEGYHQFYKLDKTKPVKAEGHTGKISAILVFGIVFTVLILAAIIYACITYETFEIQAFMGAAFFMCFGLAFLVFGIYRQKKNNRNNRAERELLKDCLCTDGIIRECKCIQHRTSHGDSDHYYYEVTLSYTYYNDRYELQYKTFKNTYSYDPEFYEGQYLMIAFNQTDSAILGKFTLEKEDEERFLRNETERSADDFDNLDNTPVLVDTSKKIRSAELEYVWLWAAVAVFVIIAAFIIPISVFAVPDMLTGKLIPDIFIYLIIYLIPLVFTALFIFLIVKYFKKRRLFKKILNNNPNFVWGKIFASEKTYRSRTSKKVFYCYIDFYGGRHTKNFSGSAVRKSVQGNPTDVVVMYDNDGNSIPLYSYSLNEE